MFRSTFSVLLKVIDSLAEGCGDRKCSIYCSVSRAVTVPHWHSLRILKEGRFLALFALPSRKQLKLRLGVSCQMIVLVSASAALPTTPSRSLVRATS